MAPGRSLDSVQHDCGPGAQLDNGFDEFLDVLPAALDLVSASATSGTATANLAADTVTWKRASPASSTATSGCADGIGTASSN